MKPIDQVNNFTMLPALVGLLFLSISTMWGTDSSLPTVLLSSPNEINYDAGMLTPEQTLNTVLPLRDDLGVDVIITSVTPGCSCTTASKPASPVPASSTVNTNWVLRLLLGDIPIRQKEVEALIERLAAKNDTAFIGVPVLLEVTFVLKKKRTKEEIINAIDGHLTVDVFTIDHSAEVREALELWRRKLVS